MKILITGSSGYVGNFLAEHFTQLGHIVIGCDLRPLVQQLQLKNFLGRTIDVTDSTAVQNLLASEKPQIVIHLAYLMDPLHDPKLEERIDVQGSMNVLNASNTVASVKQFILFSSTSAYGARRDNPLWIDETRALSPNDYVYGIHKKTVEERYSGAALRSDLKLVVLRMCTAVGPTYYKPGGVVASFTRSPIAPMLGGQDTQYQWIHEDDVKALVAQIVADPTVEGTFNLVPDSYTTLTQMAELQNKRVVRVPIGLFRGIIRTLWKLHIGSTSPPMVRLMAYGIVASPEKLKKRYGYKFQYDSLAAFRDAVEKRKANGTLS